jgi:hypothetical protein
MVRAPAGGRISAPRALLETWSEFFPSSAWPSWRPRPARFLTPRGSEAEGGSASSGRTDPAVGALRSAGGGDSDTASFRPNSDGDLSDRQPIASVHGANDRQRLDLLDLRRTGRTVTARIAITDLAPDAVLGTVPELSAPNGEEDTADGLRLIDEENLREHAPLGAPTAAACARPGSRSSRQVRPRSTTPSSRRRRTACAPSGCTCPPSRPSTACCSRGSRLWRGRHWWSPSRRWARP